jgi:hypothetical protein
LIPDVVAWLMMYVSLEVTSMANGLACAWMGMRAGVRPCVSTQGYVGKARERVDVS